MDNMEHMENDERHIVSYDTQTGEAIYSDGTRGERRDQQSSSYRFGPETMKYQQDSYFERTRESSP